MPLVRISFRVGKSASYRKAVADGVHRALIETINIPEKDRFQILTEHAPADLIIDPTYLDIERSEDAILVQITLSHGRSLAMKQALYSRMAELLSKSPGLRQEDLFVSLIEVAKENWSFG